jgi:hypothetical protein
MRRWANWAIVVPILVLGSCQKFAGGANDFVVTTRHDAFKGDISIATRNFSNDDGSIGQVTLRCAADLDKPQPNLIVDFFQGLAGAMSNIALGAKSGCPVSGECSVAMEIVFLNDGKPVPLVVQQGGTERQPGLVTFLVKDESTNRIEKYSAFLERSGTTFYNNAIRIPIPTRGANLTRWLYRFELQQRQQPVDIALDYTSTGLRSFVAHCNELSPLPSKPVVATAPPSAEVPLPSSGTPDGHTCASVIGTPDGFLAVRDGPGPKNLIVAQLKPHDFVDVDICSADSCAGSWRHVEHVDWDNDSNGQHPVTGWVNGRYLVPEACGDEP